MATFAQLKQLFYPHLKPILDPVLNFCGNDIPIQKGWGMGMHYLNDTQSQVHFLAFLVLKQDPSNFSAGVAMGFSSMGILAKGYRKLSEIRKDFEKLATQQKTKDPVERKDDRSQEDTVEHKEGVPQGPASLKKEARSFSQMGANLANFLNITEEHVGAKTQSYLDKFVEYLDTKGITIEARVFAIVGLVALQYFAPNFMSIKNYATIGVGFLYGDHFLNNVRKFESEKQQ
jgi:hypothetical protein